jgi:DNA-binding CsgD family transcriptional regulator
MVSPPVRGFPPRKPGPGYAGVLGSPIRRFPDFLRRLSIWLVRRPAGSVLLLLRERLTRLEASRLRGMGLTARQSEVLAWLAQGKSDREIATIFGSRSRTVARHLEHIYAWLGVENRTAAVSRVLDFLLGVRG